MPATLRLSQSEQDLLRRKGTDVNKILINNGHAPLKESELAHIVLELTLKHVRADKDGKIFIDL